MFVVLEGLDGAGTTTQAQLLADALRARDVQVCLTAEPSDGDIGKLLRAHLRGDVSLGPQETALAFTADRADHLTRVVKPALEQGRWVVCDRYLLSTLAYQGAEGVDRNEILAASESFEVPDLTVFLDVSSELRAMRMSSRETIERYEAFELAERLRDSYQISIELLRAGGHLIEIVDGSLPPDVVLHEIISRLDALT